MIADNRFYYTHKAEDTWFQYLVVMFIRDLLGHLLDNLSIALHRLELAESIGKKELVLFLLTDLTKNINSNIFIFWTVLNRLTQAFKVNITLKWTAKHILALITSQLEVFTNGNERANTLHFIICQLIQSWTFIYILQILCCFYLKNWKFILCEKVH